MYGSNQWLWLVARKTGRRRTLGVWLPAAHVKIIAFRGRSCDSGCACSGMR